MSLRRRLLFALVGVVTPVVFLMGIGLYLAVARATWASFDDELASRASLIADFAEYDEDGLEFEPGPNPPVRVRGGADDASPDLEMHALFDGEGELLSASSFEGVRSGAVPPALEVPVERPGAVGWLEGDGAGPWRYRVSRFRPRLEPEARALVESGALPRPPELTLVVASTTADEHRLLWRIGSWFAAIGLVTLGTAVLAGWWVVGRGLAPVTALQRELSGIDANRLGHRLETAGLPPELAAVALQTNGLLERLEVAFERERNFSADVAHELRTPLATLRAELELLRGEAMRSGTGDEAALGRAVEDVDAIAGLVRGLSILSRADAGALTPSVSEVPLRELVATCWRDHEGLAQARDLAFDLDVPPCDRVRTDPELLRVVVSNLLGNAAAYTEAGGKIRVHRDGEAWLAVSDSGPVIPAVQRARLFERFWRGDLARTQVGGHGGLGLSLVRTVARVLGLRAVCRQTSDGWMTFELQRATARPATPEPGSEEG